MNLIVVPEFLWFVFPPLGWDIGLAAHYILGVRHLERSLAEELEETERLAERRIS